ncbi:MAG TPA: outer membrane beta-barrel protein [Gemmatimonadaceae bacterium]|nr:outer membrane beta-barrel protein [Gemmatimonadaceae bacterium]
MRPNAIVRSLLAMSLLVVIAVPARAQGIKLEASLVHSTPGGDDFDGSKAGIGFDLAAVLSTPAKFSVAAGIQRTTHELEGSSDKIAALQFYAEPRMALGMLMGPVSPYLYVCASYVNNSGDIGAVEMKQKGFGFGGGLGIKASLPMSGLSWHASAGFHSIKLGDVENDGTTVPNSDASGTMMTLRAGVSFSFGPSM